MSGGIYEIVHIASGKRYIGQTGDFFTRWAKHRHRLRKGTHHSPKLQNAWNKHGGAAFRFRALLVCAPKDLLDYEQRCLDGLKPEFNIAPAAGSCLGVRRGPQTAAHIEKRVAPLRGRRRGPFSSSWLENMAAAQRGKVRGPHTAATRAKIAASNSGKKRTAAQSAAQSARQRGRVLPPFTAAHRAKLSAARKGKPLSATHRAALSRAAGAR